MAEEIVQNENLVNISYIKSEDMSDEENDGRELYVVVEGRKRRIRGIADPVSLDFKKLRFLINFFIG